MSDLSASQCGCNERPSCNHDNGCGGILWIIILLCLCNGNGGGGMGCGGCGGGCDHDCGNNGCEGIIFLILILSCCGNGNSIF